MARRRRSNTDVKFRRRQKDGLAKKGDARDIAYPKITETLETYQDAYRLGLAHIVITASGGALGSFLVILIFALVSFWMTAKTSVLFNFDLYSWKVVFISLGTLCLGFGMATLAFWRSRDSEARALQARCDDLRASADAAIKEFDQFERRPRAQ